MTTVCTVLRGLIPWRTWEREANNLSCDLFLRTHGTGEQLTDVHGRDTLGLVALINSVSTPEKKLPASIGDAAQGLTYYLTAFSTGTRSRLSA